VNARKELELGNIAHKREAFVKGHKAEIGKHFLLLAESLVDIHDNKLWKYLDHDSFSSFLAQADVNIPRSTAYRWMDVFKFFINAMCLTVDSLSGIDGERLKTLYPIVKGLPPHEITEWLSKAQEYSKSDFINEVREHRGQGQMKSAQAREKDKRPTHPAPLNAEEFNPEYYFKRVKEAPCCVCGNPEESPPHHWPKTTGAGTEWWKAIPLCKECHAIFHSDPSGFFWTYRVKIIDWFYGFFI
jgi:hypothetical protein